MKTLVRYCFIVLLMGMVIVTTNTSLVSACSGGSPWTLKELISSSDTVVQASVTEVDDVSQNAILKVESYLVGGAGPEYLLFVNSYPIITSYILAGRSAGGDCLGLGSDIVMGKRMYLFLRRNTDGAYQTINNFIYSFPAEDSTIEVYLNEGMTYGEGQKVKEDEFIRLITRESGEKPSSPIRNTQYPLKAPLQITTTSGKQYELPVDGKAPFEITEAVLREQLPNLVYLNFGFIAAYNSPLKECLTLSPDRLHFVVQSDANTIMMQGDTKVVGQASLFSSTSDSIAVWNECDLTIYDLFYPRLFKKGTEYRTTVLNGDDNCHAFAKAARWSPNGRILVYSDEKGLWLWDTFDLSGPPRLLAAASDDVTPLANLFSPLGGYLSVTEGSKRYTLDLLTGTVFPDGVVSPDDRLLLKYDTSKPIFDLELCSFFPYQCQSIGDMYIQVFDEPSGEIIRCYCDLSRVRKVEWTGKSEFVVSICVPEDPRLCAIFNWFPYGFQWNKSQPFKSQSFEYDSANNTLAILKDGETVIVNDQIYNLSSVIDSEIVNIEWLPPLFYRN